MPHLLHTYLCTCCLAPLLFVALGCGQDRSQRHETAFLSNVVDPSNGATRIHAEQMEMFGVQLRLPNSNRGRMSLKPEAKQFEWSNGQLTLRMVQHRVYVNGQSYGDVSKGDVLKVSETGTVVVNDEQREPH